MQHCHAGTGDLQMKLTGHDVHHVSFRHPIDLTQGCSAKLWRLARRWRRQLPDRWRRQRRWRRQLPESVYVVFRGCIHVWTFPLFLSHPERTSQKGIPSSIAFPGVGPTESPLPRPPFKGAAKNVTSPRPLMNLPGQLLS